MGLPGDPLEACSLPLACRRWPALRRRSARRWRACSLSPLLTGLRGLRGLFHLAGDLAFFLFGEFGGLFLHRLGQLLERLRGVAVSASFVRGVFPSPRRPVRVRLFGWRRRRPGSRRLLARASARAFNSAGLGFGSRAASFIAASIASREESSLSAVRSFSWSSALAACLSRSALRFMASATLSRSGRGVLSSGGWSRVGDFLEGVGAFGNGGVERGVARRAADAQRGVPAK